MDWFLYDADLHHEKVNLFQANVPLMEKQGGWFLLAKCVKNMVMDLHLYLKCQSSTGVFHTFR